MRLLLLVKDVTGDDDVLYTCKDCDEVVTFGRYGITVSINGSPEILAPDPELTHYCPATDSAVQVPLLLETTDEASSRLRSIEIELLVARSRGPAVHEVR